MTAWYYADHQNQQQGPVSADALLDLHRQGHLNDNSLVWTEGMADWSAFHTQREQLLAAAGNPASVPGPPPQAAASWHEAVPAAMAAAPVVQAGLWRRFAAWMIDNVLTSILAALLLFPVAVVTSTSALSLMGMDQAPLPASLQAVQWLVYLVVPAAYFVLLHASTRQASLGKLAVGIKVCRSDGSRISVGRALARHVAQLLFIVLTCGLGAMISGLMVAFSNRKQALHDMICDTLVVDRHAFTDRADQQRRGLDAVTIVVLVLSALLLMGVFVLAVLAGAALAAMVA